MEGCGGLWRISVGGIYLRWWTILGDFGHHKIFYFYLILSHPMVLSKFYSYSVDPVVELVFGVGGRALSSPFKLLAGNCVHVRGDGGQKKTHKWKRGFVGCRVVTSGYIRGRTIIGSGHHN